MRQYRDRLALVAALCGFFLSCKPISDFDVDWHLAAGRWMLENRSFIHFDPFSYTFAGKPWMSIPWLHEVITWALYSVMSDGGVVFGMSCLSAACLWLVFRLIANPDDSLLTQLGLLALVLLVGLISADRWHARPEMWSHFFGVTFSGILLRELSTAKSDKMLYLLIPLQILWVNTHGIFILGPLLFLAALTGRLSQGFSGLRPWLFTGAGVLLACLINPRGSEGALFPFHLHDVLKSPVFSTMIPEGTPPFGRGAWSSDAWYLVAILVVFGITATRELFLHARATDTRFAQTFFGCVVLLITAYTALAARRNIPLVALWGLPFFGITIKRLLSGRWLALASGLLLVVVLVLHAEWFRASYHSLPLFRQWENMPEEVAQFVENNAIFGPTYTTATEANYLLRRLPNHFRPYIDSRFAEVYDENHFYQYMNILAAPPLLESEVAARGIDNAIIGHHLGLAAGMLGYLGKNTQVWQLVHVDPIAAIFVRRGSPEYAAWANLEEAKMIDKINSWRKDGPPPGLSTQHLTGLGRALSILDHSDIATRFFERAVLREPENYEALAGLCNALTFSCTAIAAVDRTDCLTRALSTCNKAMVHFPKKVQAILASGILLLELAQPAEAVNRFRKCIRIDPNSFEANMMLGQALLEISENGQRTEIALQAIKAYEQASKLRPNHPQPLFMVGHIFGQLQNIPDAIQSYQRALSLNPPSEAARMIEERLKRIAPNLGQQLE